MGHATNRECPPFFLTPGYQSHIPPDNYTGDSPVIKQDTILLESEIQHADEILELMYEIMTRNDADWWPITGHIQIIPVRPSGIMDENLIGRYAMKQNCFVNALESYTLRGYKNIDDRLYLNNGNEMTLREIILYSKGPDGDYLFEMVERASGDRTFLVYQKYGSNNTRRRTVRHFASQLQQELLNEVSPESLETMRATNEDIRPYNENETPKESFTKALNSYAEMLLMNPQEEEPIDDINTHPKKRPKKISPINQLRQTTTQKQNRTPKSPNPSQKNPFQLHKRAQTHNLSKKTPIPSKTWKKQN